jgi:hypothetical protein
MSQEKNVTLFSGSSGINNIIDPVRLKFDPETGIAELAEAVNVDIDDTGRISRRAGLMIIEEGQFHSVFCNGGDCFVANDRTDDSALYRVAADYSLSGVRSGLQKGARLSYCQIGDKTYYTNGYQNGVIVDGISSAWPTNAHVGTTTTRAFYQPPAGTHIAHFNASMWIVEGNVIWVTEPYAYGKLDKARRFFQFASAVTMVRPVKNGVWVSDSHKTGFISGAEKFEAMRFDTKSPFPAHEWSDCMSLVDLSQTRFEVPGLSAIWSSDAGLCVGTETGDLVVVTERSLVYPSGSIGATVVLGNSFAINNVF